MNNSSRGLKILFILLLLVAVAEVVYLFVSHPQKQNAGNLPVPTPCLSCQNVSGKSAIDPSNIDFLGSVRKDNWNYILFQQVSGKVSNLTNDGEKISYSLVDDRGSIVEDFSGPIFSSTERQFFIQDGDVKTFVKDFQLADLKEGMYVKISRHYDLSKPTSDNLILNEIIILK